MRVRERDGQEFQRVGIDLPVELIRDVDLLAERDQRNRTDWLRIQISALVRARKVKKAKAA